MLSKDLLLDASHDLVIENFDLKLTNDQNSVAQKVKQTLLFFKGEWFLNANLGIPYYEEILGQKNSRESVIAVLVSHIKQVEGVKEVASFELEEDREQRTVKIKLTITDNENNQVNITV